jgi:hypothetical protein
MSTARTSTKMPTNSCGFVVGGLLEIRVGYGYRSISDVEAMITMIRTTITSRGSLEKFAIVADWRNVHIMPPEVAQRAREMLAGNNVRVTRSAILTLPEHPTTNLQVVRLVREAENPQRRHFAAVPDLQRWIGEVLSPSQSVRLSAFLAGD